MLAPPNAHRSTTPSIGRPSSRASSASRRNAPERRDAGRAVGDADAARLEQQRDREALGSRELEGADDLIRLVDPDRAVPGAVVERDCRGRAGRRAVAPPRSRRRHRAEMPAVSVARPLRAASTLSAEASMDPAQLFVHMTPASASITTPLRYEARGEATKTARSAISRGRPARPNGQMREHLLPALLVPVHFAGATLRDRHEPIGGGGAGVDSNDPHAPRRRGPACRSGERHQGGVGHRSRDVVVPAARRRRSR